MGWTATAGALVVVAGGLDELPQAAIAKVAMTDAATRAARWRLVEMAMTVPFRLGGRTLRLPGRDVFLPP